MMARKTIELDTRWTPVIREAPEAGMGYCIATIRLASGEVYEHVVIVGGTVTQVAGYGGIPFSSEEIADITVTNDRSRFGRSW
jgi:hypothetical protein